MSKFKEYFSNSKSYRITAGSAMLWSVIAGGLAVEDHAEAAAHRTAHDRPEAEAAEADRNMNIAIVLGELVVAGGSLAIARRLEKKNDNAAGGSPADIPMVVIYHGTSDPRLRD